MTDAEQTWWLYVVKMGSGALYTGISTDPDRRLDEHTSGRIGAKALKSKGPLELVYRVDIGSRSLAQRFESHFKRLRRPQKLAITASSLTRAELAHRLGIDDGDVSPPARTRKAPKETQ